MQTMLICTLLALISFEAMADFQCYENVIQTVKDADKRGLSDCNYNINFDSVDLVVP